VHFTTDFSKESITRHKRENSEWCGKAREKYPVLVRKDREKYPVLVRKGLWGKAPGLPAGLRIGNAGWL
jgi:hypothetical protein